MNTTLKTTLLRIILMAAILVAGLTSITTTFAQNKPIWVDVRTQAEFDAGHLPDAILIPYQQISQKILSVTTDKNQPINLYCRSGRRAEIALRTLERMGFTHIQNLGSYERLKKQ